MNINWCKQKNIGQVHANYEKNSFAKINLRVFCNVNSSFIRSNILLVRKMKFIYFF